MIARAALVVGLSLAAAAARADIRMPLPTLPALKPPASAAPSGGRAAGAKPDLACRIVAQFQDFLLASLDPPNDMVGDGVPDLGANLAIWSGGGGAALTDPGLQRLWKQAPQKSALTCPEVAALVPPGVHIVHRPAEAVDEAATVVEISKPVVNPAGTKAIYAIATTRHKLINDMRLLVVDMVGRTWVQTTIWIIAPSPGMKLPPIPPLDDSDSPYPRISLPRPGDPIPSGEVRRILLRVQVGSSG